MRGVPAPVERAINGALSRGPGYEPTPMGKSFDRRSVRGYYIDFTAKTISSTARQPEALPAIQLIQLALGWWDRHLDEGEPALERFLALSASVERRAVASSAGLQWPIGATVPKYRLAPGWISALAQAQAASLFVRAYIATRDARFADAALKAASPLVARRSELVCWTHEGPILEEAPSDPPSHILNGWMSALWGLWDVHLGLGDVAAGTMFESSVECLGARLGAYDTGWWSRYGLYPHAIDDLAKPIYHRFHVTQLDVLHRLTRETLFAQTAKRWAEYDRVPARLRAIGQKAVFAVLERPRRARWQLDGDGSPVRP